MIDRQQVVRGTALRIVLSMALSMIWLVGCTIQPILPVGTPTALPTLLETLLATTPPLVSETVPAPDGAWRAEVIIYPCTVLDGAGSDSTEEVSYEQLILRDVATENQTEIMHQQINCGGLGAYGLAVLCWSADSQLLYFTDAREGVPDGAGDWQRPILQFDPRTGQSQPYTGEIQAAQTALPRPVACV